MQEMENLLDGFEEPQYQYVGFWPRLGALVIDGVILAVLSWFLSILMGELNHQLLLMILTFSIPLFYNILLEYRFAATLGKMLLKLKIVNYQLQPPTISNVLLRNIIYMALQFTSLGIELANYVNMSSNEDLHFGSISDLFTAGVTIAAVYSLVVVVVYIVELVFMQTDPKFRSLHDRIGKTYVVKDVH